jgi:hypothetical protein
MRSRVFFIDIGVCFAISNGSQPVLLRLIISAE